MGLASASLPNPEEGCCASMGNWKDVKHGVTCNNCAALVSTQPYQGRCDKYCESFGHVCIAAAEEHNNDCDVLYRAKCGQKISDTSDMLCVCSQADCDTGSNESEVSPVSASTPVAQTT